MARCTTHVEYVRALSARRRTVSENASRRFRARNGGESEPILPLPPMPQPPLVRVAYEADGTYLGRMADDDELPAGATVKMEAATW